MLYLDMQHFITTYIGLLLGILMIVLPIPLLTGRIPRNIWYGVRIPKAYTSDENWKAINRYGAKVLIIWGILDIVTTSFLLLFVKEYQVMKNLHELIPLIFLGCALVQIFIYSSKLN